MRLFHLRPGAPAAGAARQLSKRGNHLRPDGDHSDEQGKRRQGGSFLGNGTDHDFLHGTEEEQCSIFVLMSSRRNYPFTASKVERQKMLKTARDSRIGGYAWVPVFSGARLRRDLKPRTTDCPVMARIPAVDLNCVFYLYPDEEAANSGLRLGGSGFWVALASEKIPDYFWVYAVSNRHVVHQGCASVIRANARGGEGVTIIPTEPTDWVEHPAGHDIAAISMHVPSLWPVIELIAVAPKNFTTEQHIEDQSVGVGDDVYMIGRFINHEGRTRNTPSARFGNISMMPTEPIFIDSKSPSQESFAVELRSMCGYSGSPVFVQMSGWKRTPDGAQKLHWDVDLLLGVHWGHIVEPWTVEKRIVKTRRTALASDEREIDLVGANTGMNGVVPAWRLRELLDLPVFKDARERDEANEMERSKREAPSAKIDSATDDAAPPASDANPNAREDFKRLLGAAVKKREPEDQT